MGGKPQAPDKPGRKRGGPLYAQVRQLLRERIRSGAWRPGQLLPNEFEIADQFGVSQGTARKALDALAQDGLVVRRQGRGTFVVEHTPAHVMFRFFHLYENGGAQILPGSRNIKIKVGRATDAERTTLLLARGANVIRISRIRTHGDKPFIVETITLPEALFPGLAEGSHVPNTLYDLFQKTFGILVVRADERISAIAASPGEARALGVPKGAPLLKIDRVGFGLDETPVEWRVSAVHLDKAHYFSRLK
ncbi:MAG: GntR family transcriptional regulator [Hyphomicrobiaceae bacterium]|jgi:GntR family transcriptional regulator